MKEGTRCITRQFSDRQGTLKYYGAWLLVLGLQHNCYYHHPCAIASVISTAIATDIACCIVARITTIATIITCYNSATATFPMHH